MEGAERAEICPRPLQRQIRADDIDDVIGGANLLEKMIGNEPHAGELNRSGGGWQVAAGRMPSELSAWEDADGAQR